MKTNIDNSTVSSIYKGITSQTDVHASRAFDNTIYQNTSLKPIYVSVTCNLQNQTLNAYSDSNANPSLLIGELANGNPLNGSIYALGFWVLPGNYYRIYAPSVSINSWIEYT